LSVCNSCARPAATTPPHPPRLTLHPLNTPPPIQAHVEALRAWTHDALIALRHSNGQPLVALFGKHHFPEPAKVQGGIFNFAVLKPDASRE
jgi:hypothetical protein